MRSNLNRILDIFFTSPEHLVPFLQEMEKQVLVDCFADVLHRYANDMNSSALRELFVLFKAGYEPRTKKLGYNGHAPDGRPCDVKPINIRSTSGDKLNARGNFSDFTYERLERYLADDVIMLVSGFIDGRLIYILRFPFSYLETELRRQLDRYFQTPRQPGQYLRSASFSFKHYQNCPELQVLYREPDLQRFQPFLTRNLFRFLRA